ncbi:MAG: cytochrome c biogenesis protein [Opitutales bacterium]|jgi:ABC-type transport system involved in cytochrome c biogenesis permease subunit
MKRLGIILITLLALAMGWPIAKPLIRKDTSAEAILGRMPVLEGGRVKPLDSVARSSLLLFRGKQSIRHEGERIAAITWLTDLIFNREAANALPVFRIDHPDLLGMFGLEAGTKKYFSYNDLEPYLSKLQQQARQVNPEPNQRNPYEAAVNQLFGSLIQYQRLSQTVYPGRLRQEVGQFYQLVSANILEAAAKFAGSGETSPEKFTTPKLQMQMRQLNGMAESPLFLLYYGEAWKTPGEVMIEGIPSEGQLPEAMAVLAELAGARKAGDEAAFAMKATKLASFAPSETGEHPAMEYYFNQSQPFIVSLQLYVLVSLLVFLGWLFSPSVFLPSAYRILLLGFAIHTAGLVLRVVITGYAPVTNLYSSAVGVGWVAVLISLSFEYLQKKGVGSLAAATVGFLTLLVAHHLSDSGDTMEKMRAVLNSNFWLSTHVITITMGYGATFVAGFLGIIYTFYAWFRRGIDKEMQQSFHRMIYGAVCFSLLFSFVGTVLGGIWADQSWGRFWGWDPKENGALMIVLWTAMMLHALRGGLIKTRGLVNLAIVGNVITAWSWFGTNMLGIGLHSYGFMDSAFFWLVVFWISQFAIIFLEWLFPVSLKRDRPA